MTSVDALVIGAGPAGLMAADVLSANGLAVLLVDGKSSFGRKFLMAGKSGLNITKDETPEKFLQAYGQADWLLPALSAFGPEQAKTWALGLGQEIFTGSSGRVFPKGMKASPILRAWLGRLAAQGVAARTHWRWTGWEGADFAFATPDGPRLISAKVAVLALGGGSWARLGSDATWVPILAQKGVEFAPFRPSNVGFDVAWSPHMAKLAGQPVKPVRVSFGSRSIRGEFVLTKHGIEGGVIYALASSLVGVDEPTITLDLLPDLSMETIAQKLSAPRGKLSFSNFLRKTLGLTGVKAALLYELGTVGASDAMARTLKKLPLKLTGPRPIDEAISTAGGVSAASLDGNLMLHKIPGVFCAGEMLDWDAPTGGYLITACLATGRHAGLGALARFQLAKSSTPDERDGFITDFV